MWWRLAGDRGPGENTVLTQIVFSLRSAAERLRKQWEEEEKERLKQISVPAEPKSKKGAEFCSFSLFKF